jgi:predicted nucleic acid-binding protein
VALTHLADTSVLTRLAAPTVREAVAPLLAAGAIGRTGITDLELGYSARTAREWDRLAGAVAAFPSVETDAAHVVRARQVQRLLASRSQRGKKVPDLLIAAAAEILGLVVLHYDRDFDLISRATGQQCEWVVARGSVD